MENLSQPMSIQTGRLVVNGQIAHQLPNEQPTALSIQYSIPAQSDEQPYQRRCRVGEDWESFDLGWVQSKIAMIVIANLEGVFSQVNPTQEEREEAARKILQIGIEEPILEIRPRESQPLGHLSQPTKWKIRCLSGSCRFTITVFPE